jgi:hypothetical protein
MTNQQLRQIYDGFVVKDMSFPDFVKEMKSLSDPVKIQEDLSKIQMAKANRAMIDNAIKKGNN